ncbi:MAG TPA: hypothetical protein VF972_09250 [Actinomycetota bacterium]
MGRRLILGAFYLLVVVVVGLAVPFGATLSARLTEELGGRVEREAFTVSAALEDPIERGSLQGLQPLVVRFGSQIGGRVLATDGRGVLLADSLRSPGTDPPSYASRPEIAAALSGRANWVVRSSATLGYAILVSAVPIRSAAGVIGTVRISYPMAAVEASIHRTWWFLAAVGSVTLLVGLALAGHGCLDGPLTRSGRLPRWREGSHGATCGPGWPRRGRRRCWSWPGTSTR